jgi:hypothetical protein
MRTALDTQGKLMMARVDAGDERWSVAAHGVEAKASQFLEQCRKKLALSNV